MSDVSASPAIPSPEATPVSSSLSPWEHVSFTVRHAVAWALLLCLGLRGLYVFGRAFGTLEWLTDYKRRRRFAKALIRLLGRESTARERRRETREYFMRTRCEKLLYLGFDCIPRERAASLLTIDNKSLLDDALARGRGVYLAMSHHGSQHVVAMLLAINGYRTLGVRDRNEGPLRRFVQERFDRRYPEFGRTRWLFADSMPREVYRCLREGYIVGGALDVGRIRSEHQRTEEVVVFGEKRRFPSGPLHIAVRCGSPVLQVLIQPEKDFRHRLVLPDMLIDPEKVTDESAAIAQAMQTYATNVERHAKATPSLIGRV